MPDVDAFQLNIDGARQLVESDANKARTTDGSDEGIEGDFDDILTLNKSDAELLLLKDQYEAKYSPYEAKLKPRQEANKKYYKGTQRATTGQDDKVVSSNLIFEAEETFIPQALSQNPEPVIWSDNTNEGKEASNQIKTMLQYHADVLCLRKKLGVMLRHWSIYFVGVMKHGWDEKGRDIKTEIRKPQNFLLDPDGYIDEFGNFIGDFLGERCHTTAKKLMEMFPSNREYISLKVNGKHGTRVIYTEWWTDDYCFSTFEDVVLDKHKNEFYNYETMEKDEYGIETATPGQNHFAHPKMPYTFLSVFSLQEQPHDVTNLIEQNIPNQNDINDNDTQVSKNLRHGNNSIAVSGKSFNKETAREAAQALEDGDPVLVPDGQVEAAIKRFPASPLPPGLLESLQIKKDALRGVFGVQGLAAQPQKADTTARGMILNQSHDSTRIGGGVGDALEQVADNIFNWWLQLYYVFYDEPHYGAVLGSGKAVEYVMLVRSNMNRNFVVSVAPNSMQPKDEITEQNLSIDLANKGWLDPINLFKKLNYPDPLETAKMVTLYKIDPMAYYQQFFPQEAMQMQQSQMMQNPPDLNQPPMPQDQSLAAPPASAGLSQVPLNQ